MHQSNGKPAEQGPLNNQQTILAIASAGGHWVQLNRLRPAFKNARLILATTKESYRSEVSDAIFRVVPDCNRWEKFKLLKSALSIFWLIVKERPDVIITTGAAPGYFAILIGRILGKYTIWVDSIANAEELSMSGQKAGKHAKLWITQWQHLEKPEGPFFYGNVIGDETPQGALANAVNDQPADNQPLADRHVLHSLGEGGSPEGEVGSAISNRDKKLKIFVTVGTDLPFDRLVQTIDEWASKNPSFNVFAQIGESRLTPTHIDFCKFIEPVDFKKRFQAADLVISHAGMGTILSSLQYNTPLIVMPRIARLGEHRNEHQLATAKHLQRLDKINVAADETQLIEMLNEFQNLPPISPIGPYASDQLVEALRTFAAKKGK